MKTKTLEKGVIIKYKRLLVLFISICMLPINVTASRGCCSQHNGISHCDTSIGMYVCKDGVIRKTCTCEKVATTRTTITKTTTKTTETATTSTITNTTLLTTSRTTDLSNIENNIDNGSEIRNQKGNKINDTIATIGGLGVIGAVIAVIANRNSIFKK